MLSVIKWVAIIFLAYLLWNSFGYNFGIGTRSVGGPLGDAYKYHTTDFPLQCDSIDAVSSVREALTDNLKSLGYNTSINLMKPQQLSLGENMGEAVQFSCFVNFTMSSEKNSVTHSAYYDVISEKTDGKIEFNIYFSTVN